MAKRVGDLATWAAVVLALVSLAAIVYTAAGYARGMRAVRELRFVLNDVTLTSDRTPDMVADFTLRNHSPVSLRIDALNLSFYLNGSYVGSNYAPFARRTIGAFEEQPLQFVIPLQPLYVSAVERATASGQFAWVARGAARVVLPFRERTLLVQVRERWSGR